MLSLKQTPAVCPIYLVFESLFPNKTKGVRCSTAVILERNVCNIITHRPKTHKMYEYECRIC